MTSTQQRLTILILILFSGCEQRPVMTPHSPPEAIERPQATVELTDAEAASDATIQTSDIVGRVVGVIDGDTIDILADDMTTTRIHLNGIDAPEKGQPWGTNATELLSGLVFDKTVRVVTYGEDIYGRTIGEVFVRLERSAKSDPDANVNFMMVANGHAWHYVKYAPDRNDLAKGEKNARGIKLALWSDPNPVAPWEWRKLSKDERDKLR